MANTMSPHFECIAPYFQSPAERSQRVLQLRKKVKSFVYGKPRPDPDWLMHLSVETQYRFGLTDAARRGDTGAVKTLLNHGADPNSRDRQGDPAIVLAAMCNRPLVAQLLISAKADLNLCTGLGDTALIWSSWLGEFRLARILVNAGASLDAHGRGPACGQQDRAACRTDICRADKRVVELRQGVIRYSGFGIRDSCWASACGYR